MLFSLMRVVAFLCAIAFVLARPALAHAFCRATTLEPLSDCECIEDGLPLYWDRNPIPYALNERGFPGLHEETLRDVLAASFANWTEVVCDDEPVMLSVEQLAATTPMVKDHLRAGANLNVFVHLSAEEFTRAGGDPDAYALTSTFMNMVSGEIVGADIMFNEGLGPFTICPPAGCTKGTDLENVATHEIGHFFGLGHSDVEDSTMECRAPVRETKKRSLEADDEAGICAIYAGPVVRERSEALHGPEDLGGCQLSSGRTLRAAPLSLLALLVLFLDRRARWRART